MAERIVRWLEVAFLVIVILVMCWIIWHVMMSAGHLNTLAEGFEQKHQAYDLAVVQTLVGPFEKIVAAFVVYAFGKLGAKVVDNRHRIAADKGHELHDMSIFG